MDVRNVVQRLGGAASLARAIGFERSETGAKLVRAWVMRNSIPAKYFASIARVAEQQNLLDITVAQLADCAETAAIQRSDGRLKAIESSL
jgi:hypothetical protein